MNVQGNKTENLGFCSEAHLGFEKWSFPILNMDTWIGEWLKSWRVEERDLMDSRIVNSTFNFYTTDSLRTVQHSWSMYLDFLFSFNNYSWKCRSEGSFRAVCKYCSRRICFSIICKNISNFFTIDLNTHPIGSFDKRHRDKLKGVEELYSQFYEDFSPKSEETYIYIYIYITGGP